MNAKRILMFSTVVPFLICSHVIAALVIQQGPSFANIDAISLTIDYPKNAPVLKEYYWDSLKTQFEQKLKKANLNVSSARKTSWLKTDVKLIVNVELLKVPDVNLFAVRVETVMARQMLLATGSDQLFIVPLCLGRNGIRFVSENDLPGIIENAASRHIDQFIRNYQATKSWQAKKTAQAKTTETNPEPSTTTLDQVQQAKHSYVASNSSNIFHKPECRWARNISQKNLVDYKSKDEAIKAGKRPCKTCNP